MNIRLLKLVSAIAVLMALDACVSYPQPIGYRMTSDSLPTYVNGQYVGMRPNVYVPPMPINAVPVPDSGNYATTTAIYAYDPDSYYGGYYDSPFYNVGFGYWGGLGWGGGWYGGYPWYGGFGGYRGYGDNGYRGWHGGNGGANEGGRSVEHGGFAPHARGHR